MARPRIVPEDKALERALLLFWRKGYDRTSVSELGEAMGISPSSLYNAFESKAVLFERALQRYMETHASSIQESLETDSDQPVAETVRSMLHSACKVYKSGKLPSGCALLQGGGAGIPGDSEAAAITFKFKKQLESLIRNVLEVAEGRGERFSASPSILAKYLLGVMRGLSQLAVDGTKRKDLLKIANLAVMNFTSSGPKA